MLLLCFEGPNQQNLWKVGSNVLIASNNPRQPAAGKAWRAKCLVAGPDSTGTVRLLVQGKEPFNLAENN